MDITLGIAMWFFLGSAAQDWARGKINGLLLVVPAILLAVFYLEAFSRIYLAVFVAMFAIWAVLQRIPKKYKEQGLVMGFGDVLAVPLAISISYAAHPFYGLVAFAAVNGVSLPVFLKKKTRRLLPWLVPPTATALLISVFV